MASRTRHVVDLGEWEEFVVLQFLLSVENDADEQDWCEDEMASE
jgi:hypothetical protein